MFLIDTSVWIGVFRDRTGATRQSLAEIINNRPIFLSRFTQMELLQGCRDEREWTILHTYLQDHLREEARDSIYENFQLAQQEQKQGKLRFSSQIDELKNLIE